MEQEHNSISHYQLDASIGVKQRKSKLDLFHDKLLVCCWRENQNFHIR